MQIVLDIPDALASRVLALADARGFDSAGKVSREDFVAQILIDHLKDKVREVEARVAGDVAAVQSIEDFKQFKGAVDVDNEAKAAEAEAEAAKAAEAEAAKPAEIASPERA